MNRKTSQIRATSPEKLALRFEPDVLTTYRYSQDCRPNLHFQPEKRLMLAVLEDAFYCLQRFHFAKNRRGKNSFEEAHDWVWSDQRDWPFSFTNICDALGLDPNHVRKGLLRWSGGRAHRIATELADRDRAKKTTIAFIKGTP